MNVVPSNLGDKYLEYLGVIPRGLQDVAYEKDTVSYKTKLKMTNLLHDYMYDSSHESCEYSCEKYNQPSVDELKCCLFLKNKNILQL